MSADCWWCGHMLGRNPVELIGLDGQPRSVHSECREFPAEILGSMSLSEIRAAGQLAAKDAR